MPQKIKFPPIFARNERSGGEKLTLEKEKLEHLENLTTRDSDSNETVASKSDAYEKSLKLDGSEKASKSDTNESVKKKKTRKKNLHPINLKSEMEKFLDNFPHYHPLFEYEDNDKVDEWATEGKRVLHDGFLERALQILHLYREQYRSDEEFHREIFGEERLNETEILTHVERHLREIFSGNEDYDLEFFQGEDPCEKLINPQKKKKKKIYIKIILTDKTLSLASILPQRSHYVIFINHAHRKISQSLLESICLHEIDTHLLRLINDQNQPWNPKSYSSSLSSPTINHRAKFKMSNHLDTEEGLAVLNSMLYHPKNHLLLHSAALKYVAIVYGSQMSFLDLFLRIHPFIDDPKRCFFFCCRVKRGVRDTQNTLRSHWKDQCYFIGICNLLDALPVLGDVTDLYYGHIACEDLPLARRIGRRSSLLLPPFLSSNDKINRYKEFLLLVKSQNQL